jgi:hypothetical protein
MLYSRFGNGIATNNLSKVIAGLLLPGRPIGNMYFAAWSHNVINGTVQLSMDLKLGEYRTYILYRTIAMYQLIETVKVPPRVMFLTQIYGTVLGGFINYAVMIAIVSGNRELLANTDGDSSWSGATIQSYNTNASTWALAAYIYKEGQAYSIVPFGLLIGAAFVAAHRVFYQVRRLASLHHVISLIVKIVCTQNRQVRHQRDQSSTILPIRWIHPIQSVSDLRANELDHCRVLHAVLPSQLPPPHLQGLLLPHCRCF